MEKTHLSRTSFCPQQPFHLHSEGRVCLRHLSDIIAGFWFLQVNVETPFICSQLRCFHICLVSKPALVPPPPPDTRLQPEEKCLLMLMLLLLTNHLLILLTSSSLHQFAAAALDIMNIMTFLHFSSILQLFFHSSR